MLTNYEQLNISVNATQDEIRAAYKSLVKKYHPDVYKGKKEYAQDMMAAINNAYEILSDPAARAQYDNSLREQMPENPAVHTYSGWNAYRQQTQAQYSQYADYGQEPKKTQPAKENKQRKPKESKQPKENKQRQRAKRTVRRKKQLTVAITSAIVITSVAGGTLSAALLSGGNAARNISNPPGFETGDNGGGHERPPWAVRLAAPAGLSVQDKILVWEICLADSYTVSIDGAEQEVFTNSFSLQGLTEPGIYIIRVRANGNGTAFLDSEFSTPYSYVISRILAMPTGLLINGANLSWNAVPNADSYTVSVDGAEHKAFTNSFSLQGLTEPGIYNIKVRADGNGTVFLDSEFSVSYSHLVSQTLPAPTGLRIDGTNLRWSAVLNAVSYTVLINGTEHTVTGTSHSLLGLPAGIYTVSVRANGNRVTFLDSEFSSSYSHVVQTLSAPSGLRIEGTNLRWNAVPNAAGYTVVINGIEHTVTGTSHSLVGLPLGIHTIRVRANGGGTIFLDSEFSVPFNHIVSQTLSAPANLRVQGRNLIWDAVPNAVSYTVFINGTEHTVTGTSHSLANLPAGNYTISVRANGDGVVLLDSEFSVINTTIPGGGGNDNCVAAGTLVTLADGSTVPVEQLTGSESLLVWNLFTGNFDAAPITFVDSDPAAEYEIIHLYFSDGTDVKIIFEHGFWNFDRNQYVFLRNDAAQYIGERFNKQTIDDAGNLAWTKVSLTDVIVYHEYTTAWSPVTFVHLCYYVNGMLSMPGSTEGLINIFEVDGDAMRYNEKAYLADIEEHGLFFYEDFADIIPQTIFEAFGGAYLKVSMGKKLIDFDMIHALVDKYAGYLLNE